jgi:catechol 2,3-dioxygenase-like lactoylglutathione lyase family enzyme
MTSPIARLSHVCLRTPDLQRARAYYLDVVGLADYDTSDDTVYLASGGQGPALELRRDGSAGLDHVGFEVLAAAEDELLDRLEQAGVTVDSGTDVDPGLSRIHSVEDVEGNRIQLCIVDEGRAPAHYGDTGVVPQKIGHVASRTRDAEAVAGFYEEALGFRWSDWMGDFFTFLRCNADHHTVNLVNASNPGQLHHFAFEVRDVSHVGYACDVLYRNGVPLIWGPGRHGIGHNVFTYHADPDGNLVEFFCDLDRMASEDLGYFEPRPWHDELPQRPKRWTPDPSSANKWGPLAPEGFLK